MIVFEKARKEFQTEHTTVVALEEFDLSVEEGETICLIGTSGSGKTTALKLVNRLIEPTSGRILVGGEDISRRDPIALRRNIGYVIQEGGLFPHMNVSENIGLLCRLENWPENKIAKRVDELLELVNLPAAEFSNRRPRELSGGQQQRVSVARALAFDPAIILMDEPFGALDPITRTELHEEFLNLKKRLDKTILLVTHDLAEAFYLGDRVALLENGRLAQAGTETDFTERPAGEFVRNFVGSHLTGGAQ